MSVVGEALLGALAGELLKAIIDVTSKVCNFAPDLERLKSTLERILPLTDDLKRLNSELDVHRQRNDQIHGLNHHLSEAKELVLKCSKLPPWNYYKKYRYSKQFLKLDESLIRFFQLDVQAEIWCHAKQLLVDVQEMNRRLVRHVNFEGSGSSSSGEGTGSRTSTCGVPLLTSLTVGLNVPLKELKMKLFKDEVTVLGLCAPGGCGKTTLATKLCHDEQVRGIFKDNIFFITVSSSPNLKTIIQRFLEQMVCGNKLLQNDEDAVNQMGNLLKKREPEPLLLVLDDVWSEFVVTKLLFRTVVGFKMLVTSRTEFPVFDSTYCLKMLSSSDARTLFCHSAFRSDENFERPDEALVNKIVQRCKGFPLLLTVIGHSLQRQPARKWKKTEEKLTKAGLIFELHSDLLNCLSTSLDFLPETVLECFMDLGSFIEDQRIPAAALIDIWVELYELDEDDAYVNLLELSTRNLVNLVEGTRKGAGEVDGNFNELFVTQHDLLRDLAIYQSRGHPNVKQRKRLTLNQRVEDPPESWMEQENQPFDARLVSIHTDQMSSSNWCKLQFPETKVLLLNFSATNYRLPQFMDKMDKLKVLIITNNATHHAKLSGLTEPNYLSHLKRIRLEKVSICLLNEVTVPLKNLQKISLVMCEINHALKDCNMKMSDMLPSLIEINVDYCDNLVELPEGICDLSHLQKLSITNCHKLFALPEEIGKMKDLEVLRLHACTGLLELPDSIRKLQKLRLLDISDCSNMERMPEGVGDLCGLRTLDMRRCTRVRKLPRSAMNLKHLKHVTCDEETTNLWEPLQLHLQDLKIQEPKDNINLDWLGI